MTENPEFVSPDMTVLEALQVMHDNKFLTLPVCEEDGTVVGLVDVMDVIYSCGGVDGWKSVFESALDVDESVAESQSVSKAPETSRKMDSRLIKVSPDAPFVSSPLPSHIPSTLEFTEGVHPDDFDADMTFTSDMKGLPISTVGPTIVFKVVDHNGHTHRLRCECTLSSVMKAFVKKVKKKNIKLKFVDDEGDAILITSDEDLAEAVKISQSSGNWGPKSVVKLTAVETEGQLDPTIVAGAAAGVALVGILVIAMLRPRR